MALLFKLKKGLELVSKPILRLEIMIKLILWKIYT